MDRAMFQARLTVSRAPHHRERATDDKGRRNTLGDGSREDARSKAFHSLTDTLMDLAVNVGLMNTMASHWPAEVQENWLEKLQDIEGTLGKDIAEVQEFASAFD